MTGLRTYRIAHGIGAAIAMVAMLAILDFAAVGAPADAYYADPSRPAVMDLARPPLPYGPNRNDGETGFPQDDAGISAYYRIPAPQTGSATDSTAPRLDVMAVAIALTSPPDAADPVRADEAAIINLGLNFGIIAIPMQGAVVPSTPSPTEVSVYFDDQGWIIAYLPADTPAAAIWRYDGAERTAAAANSNSELDDNFLSRAIGLVVSAAASSVDAYAGPSGYYDWKNPQCDAYVLFSNRVGKQSSHPVRFLIPERIDDIKASAAVLIIDHPEGGSTEQAQLRVDGAVKVSASRATDQKQHNVASFDLEIADGPVSQHAMTIEAAAGVAAVGVVMLMYDKPGP